MNGRKPGDIFGNFTSMQWNGSAAVDYVITPALDSHRIVELFVGDFSPCLSDHCPVKYKLKLDLLRTPALENPISMTKLPPRCKWNETVRASFLDALGSEQARNIFETTLNEPSLSPEKGISELTSVLLKCANIDEYSMKNNGPKKRRDANCDKPWFDKDCRDSKRKINMLANKLKRSPGDVSIRQDLFFTKKEFKNLAKRKKMLYKKKHN